MGIETFKKNLGEIDVDLDQSQFDQFEEYYKTLVEWNEFMNLTAITEYDEVMLKHFVDSLALNKALENDNISLDLNSNLKIIDIGTGAGFPGIPMKIAYENLNVTLLDSLNKRIKFLDEVISKLSLKGITAMHGRSEDYARDKAHREQYDLCVSRAVANLSTLAEYCLPYVKEGGYFIPFKSGNIDEELINAKHAVFLLGGKIVDTIKLTLPGSDIERSFVIIKKVKNTSKNYPRKAGLPAKEPLS